MGGINKSYVPRYHYLKNYFKMLNSPSTIIQTKKSTAIFCILQSTVVVLKNKTKTVIQGFSADRTSRAFYAQYLSQNTWQEKKNL